jgi:tetrapyrrole methylase family protein/MazG family protein
MARKNFDDLVQLMEMLRGPDGCPWDRQQSLTDLKPFVIEEAYEVVDAIDRDDSGALREEIGDLLLEAVFVAQIAREEERFDIYDAITAIHDKLVRRHPHVFADTIADTADAVLTNWEKMKSAERAEQNQGLLSGVPSALPALLKASRLTEKAARVGFDWESTNDVISKLEEETRELKEAIASGERKAIEHELGDLLFTLANISRRLDVNAEEALQETNRRFTRRFGYIEQSLRSTSKTFEETTLAELDRLWDEAKAGGL